MQVRGLPLRGVFTLFALVLLAGTNAAAQQVVDRTVATVADGVRSELITYSDLRWQLALQPGAPLSPPSPNDLRRALQTQIDQRIFALEAERLPRTAPNEKEISDAIADILRYFPSTAEFERRLRAVGFTSVRDENFERIIAQRVAIEKYLDFRFRSFVVVTAEDEAAHYRETWLPDFRRRNPNAIVPPFEEVRAQVNRDLIEARVAANIEKFLEEAKRRVTVTILYEIPAV